MKRSNVIKDENSDFSFIIEESHISKVWEEIERNFNKYYDKIENPNIFFLPSLQKFKEESEKYINVFEIENLNEYFDEDDAQGFKKQVQKDCPIIRHTRHAKSEKLKKWKTLWNKTDNYQEIFDTFFNIINLAENYNSNYNQNAYNMLFQFNEFNDISELNEKEFNVSGIIGAGISSTVLYNLYPHLFNRAVKRTLYGLFFLTDQKDFGLPSRTNEFIMIDDTRKKGRNENYNHTIEQNYWYRYDLFMMYSKRIFNKIKQKKSVEDSFRYVYVFRFLDFVCEQHEELIKTMIGNDQSEI